MTDWQKSAAAAAVSVILGLSLAGCAHAGAAAGGGASPGNSVAAGSPSANSPSANAVSFDGTWTGTWTRTSPPRGSGTYQWVLHQHGQQITGTLQAGRSACLTSGPLTGHASGRRITLRAVTPSVTGAGKAFARYRGVLTGDKLHGTGVVTCSAGAGTASWRMTRQ